jgi:hypothetical protein
MLSTENIILPPDVRAGLDQLQGLYGRDQAMTDSLAGLNTRLGYARQLYGPGRSIPQIVNGIYRQLNQLRQLYGSDHIEDILTEIIAQKEQLNRMVELQSKVMLSVDELAEYQSIRREFQRYVTNLARQKAAQSRAIHAKNEMAKSGLRT